MSKNCPIMQRMKENYEKRDRHFLTRRMPVIIRIDGKAFHTYTRGLDKPFDERLICDMNQTAIFLCSEIQGAKCAYVQSDEINILLTDYDKLNTQGWFDYEQNKMESISASLATAKFNYLRMFNYFAGDDLMNISKGQNDRGVGEHFKEGTNLEETKDSISSIINYMPLTPKLAFFDSRAFNIPREEVANYFLARQKDAVKNSISSVAQTLYSAKELHGKNGDQQQEMIFQKGINWNDFDPGLKRGRFIVRNNYVNGELFPPKDNSVFFENGQYHKINPIESGKVTTSTVLENPIVRNRWEVVETPMTFSNDDFKQWI